MKLEEEIIGAEHYINKFNNWNVKEKIIDDKKAFWEIRKPGSNIEKVCLFRDGSNMYIYGDYGSYTFDKMTWIGSPYNLEYNNLPYQNEKLARESKDNVYVFDEDAAKEDIIDWFRDTVIDRYYYSNDEIDYIIGQFKHDIYFPSSSFDTEYFCAEHDCDDLLDILNFANELILRSDNEIDYISFLRYSTELEDFDEVCDSYLWKAGKRTSQSYLVALLALKICGEKLKEGKDEKNNR